jgi:hypothetical protein
MNKILKISSILVTSLALGLVIGNIYYSLQNFTLTLFASIILISHLVEAIIGIIYSQKKGLNPLKSGIYVFFTGTFGLKEMLRIDN